MRTIRKIKYSKQELEAIYEQLGAYIWAAVDTCRGMIAAGDEQFINLRDALLMKKSKPEDIICAGLDLNTGEIHYANLMNRINPRITGGEIPPEVREKTSDLMRYFFEDIPAYTEERKRPRYTKGPGPLSFN